MRTAMSKHQKDSKSTLKRIVAMLVICMITAIGGNVYGNEAQAATVKISASSIKLKVGGSKKLKLKNTTKKAVWKSSNTKVATVGKSTGKVKAQGAGSATITATLNGKNYTCKVTVRELTASEKLTKALNAVKKAYGDDYLPNMSMDSQYLQEMIGLDSSTYDAIIGEMPMISAHVDTIIGVHAVSGKKSQVEAALKTYRYNQINNTFQYPSNLVKLNASEVVSVGDYVFFIMLGKINDTEENESKLLAYYQEQNAIGINAIKKVIGN